jgi:hypothetical protein
MEIYFANLWSSLRKVVPTAVWYLAVAGLPLLPQQIASTIRGSLTDQSGAVLAQAQVVLINPATNTSRTVTSNGNGDYEIPGLLRGSYRLTITHPGFKTFVADNILLETSEIRRIDASMELGAVASEVTVAANAAVITTDSGKVQESFTNKRFDNAPWIGDGRNPQTVLATLPSVQFTSYPYGIQLHGLPDSQVQTSIDGIPGDGSSLQNPTAQTAQEVSVVTNSNSAEFSRPGYITIVTKGGTNEFHGRLSYWNENSSLAARGFFDVQKPRTLFHTMNAELSGPLIRNRTFFFFSWSGQRWPSSSYYVTSVPTDQMRQGDFSQLLSGSSRTAIKDPLTGNAFPGNIIPANRLNPMSVDVMNSYLPGPNLGKTGALANNFGFLFPWPTDLFEWNEYDGRIDQKISSQNTAFFRYQVSISNYVLAGNYPAFTWTRVRNSPDFVVADTHIFSPALLNEFKFGLYRPNYLDGGTVGGVTPLKGDAVVNKLGLQGVNPQNLSAQGFPEIDIAGYSPLMEQPGGLGQNNYNWDYADSLTWSVGRHVWKFGADFRRLTNFSSNVPKGSYGVFGFTGSFTGNGFSDFLLGLPFSSMRLNPLVGRTQLDSELGLFVQDTFKVSNRLTLDLGLRWQRFGAPNYEDGLIYNWDPTTGNVIVPGNAMQSINPLYPTNQIRVIAGDAQQSPSLRNFAPRIGIAYRPFGSDFVIRGGYGIFTETLGAFARAQGSGPYQIGETFFNSIQNGQPAFAFPNPFPGGSGTVASQSITGFDPQTKNGQIHQFNVTVERQFKDIGVRLSYEGSRSRNMNYSLELNKPEPGLTPFSAARRPYPQFVSTTYWRHNGAANYNSLNFGVRRKMGQVTFDGGWTWASNYSNYLANTSQTSVAIENPYAPLGWGRDPLTAKQRVVGTVVWDLPFGKNRTWLANTPAVLDYIVGGWQLYWIGTFQSGRYFSPTYSGSDPSNTNTVGGLPSRVANGNLPSDQRAVTHWFDTKAFVTPAPGSFGNSGVNILEGPGLEMNNISLAKTFSFRERFRFTFMAAAQNAFNHANFSIPNSNISAPTTAGVISSTIMPGRQIELRGRLDF